MFGPIGLPEMLAIGAGCAILFGINKLPKLGKNLGEGIREFRNVGKELMDDDDDKKD